jgi:hypothetical protein
MLTELDKVKVQNSGRSMENGQIRHSYMYLECQVHTCKRLTGVSSFYVDFLICFQYIWFLVICQNLEEGVISKGVLTASSKFPV